MVCNRLVVVSGVVEKDDDDADIREEFDIFENWCFNGGWLSK